MDPDPQLIEGIIHVAIFIVLPIRIFLICREIVCWYLKQNEPAVLLKNIRFALGQILDTLEDQDDKATLSKMKPKSGGE